MEVRSATSTIAQPAEAAARAHGDLNTRRTWSAQADSVSRTQFQALSAIGTGSLAAAYKAIRSMELKGASGIDSPEMVAKSLNLAERSPSVGLMDDLTHQGRPIGSAVAIGAAFAAYREVME